MPNPQQQEQEQEQQQEQEHTLSLVACVSHVSDYIGVAIQALFQTLSTGKHTSIAETTRLENGFIQLQPVFCANCSNMSCSNCSNQQTTPLNRYILNTLKSIEAMAEREHPGEPHYANTLRNIFTDLIEIHKATDGLYHMLTCLINHYINLIKQTKFYKVSRLPEINTRFDPITHALFCAKFHTACSPAPETETLTEPLGELLQALYTRKLFAYSPINSNANVHYVPHRIAALETPPAHKRDGIETDNESTIGTPDERLRLPTKGLGIEHCHSLRLRLFTPPDRRTLFAKTFRTKEKKATREAKSFDAYSGVDTHLFRLSEVDKTGVATFLLLMEGYGGCITWQELCTKAVVKTLTQDQVFFLATSLVKEIRRLEAKQIVHGDLHRGNVLINPYTGDVHLVDFGSATWFEQTKVAPKTALERNGSKIQIASNDLKRYLDDGWQKCPINPFPQIPPWTQTNPIQTDESEHTSDYALDQTLNIYPCIPLLAKLFYERAPIFYLASRYAGILDLHEPEAMNMALLDDWLAVFKDPEAYLAQSNPSSIHRRTARFYRLFKKLTSENEPTFTNKDITLIQTHNVGLSKNFQKNLRALARIQSILDVHDGASCPPPPPVVKTAQSLSP